MSSLFADHFRTLARHNAWANERLYGACAELPEAEYFKPRPAFFGSIHGVLNHVLVVDRMWIGRLEERESGITALDQQLYGDFAGLSVARKAEDAHLVSYVEGLDDDDLATAVGYRLMEGERLQDPLHVVLSYVFVHQVHHRGQAHDLLSQTEVAPPGLDLMDFLRPQG